MRSDAPLRYSGTELSHGAPKHTNRNKSKYMPTCLIHRNARNRNANLDQVEIDVSGVKRFNSSGLGLGGLEVSIPRP